jgi:anti-anti-sigma regulatory factor
MRSVLKELVLMSCGDIGTLVVGRAESSGLPLLAIRPSSETDRRIEDWIASNLDSESVNTGPNLWNKLIDNLPGLRRAPKSHRSDGTSESSQGGWSRFKVAYRRGLTVVRVADQALVDRAHIEELGCDLMDLIDVGNYRVVLNFKAVERLGSWIIGVVGNAHRRCAAIQGGRLKICGLDPQLSEIFSIVGMARELDLHADETAAIESPWPENSTPRQLPVDILGQLFAIGEIPPIRGGASDQQMGDSEYSMCGRNSAALVRSPQSTETGQQPTSLSLRVQVGSSEGRTVSVSSQRLVIGRDKECGLRLGSAQVSKQHAVIERRDGKVYLRDLGSTNGTLINGRHIRDLEVEVHHDDQIQIGPVLTTVVFWSTLETPLVEPIPCDEPIDLRDSLGSAVTTDSVATEEIPIDGANDPASQIKHEVIEDVLVITPRLPELDDEATLEALRTELQSLFEEPLPRRVVVNLEFVNHVSRRTIALLLAHHLRLEWSAGGLRICQAHARIIALLDQVRLTMLVDCYPTLDEAVLASWTGSLKPVATQR